MSINPEEQSGFDAFSDPHTDPAEDSSNASSEKYTDSDEDSNRGIEAGGCIVLDLETAQPLIVEKVYDGIEAAIQDFNQRNGSTYKLVKIQVVKRTLCFGYGLSLYFAAKPAESHDNFLTNFEAGAWFVPPDYKLESVVCELKSSE